MDPIRVIAPVIPTPIYVGIAPRIRVVLSNKGLPTTRLKSNIAVIAIGSGLKSHITVRIGTPIPPAPLLVTPVQIGVGSGVETQTK